MRRPTASGIGATARVAVAVMTIGCNAILDNQPASLDDASVARDDGGGARGPGGADASQDEGAPPDVPAAPQPSATAPHDARCKAGEKECGGVCVSIVDPAFGCAPETCAPCELTNAVAVCAQERCAIETCARGFADCDRAAFNGCEASLAADDSCGACGKKCPSKRHLVGACIDGVCGGTCELGFGDCNDEPDDGCEKNLRKDKHNCGACGARCPFGRCDSGSCVWP